VIWSRHALVPIADPHLFVFSYGLRAGRLHCSIRAGIVDPGYSCRSTGFALSDGPAAAGAGRLHRSIATGINDPGYNAPYRISAILSPHNSRSGSRLGAPAVLLYTLIA
jgi:hypothetical protein